MRGFLKLAPTTCLKVESEKSRLHHHVALNLKSLEELPILRNPHVAQSVKSGGGMVTRFRVHALCHFRGLFEGRCYPRSPATHIVGPWVIDSLNLCRDLRTGTQYR